MNKQLQRAMLYFAVAAFCIPLSAFAELGGNPNSISNDRAKLKGSLQVVHAAAYDVHQMQLPSGIGVKEYVSPDGKVFAVSWQGQAIPNLKQLLGSYFEQYSRAASGSRRGHGPLLVQLPGLVVQSAGHARAFVGRAYVPQMIPQGVQLEAIR